MHSAKLKSESQLSENANSGHVELRLTSKTFSQLICNGPDDFSPEILCCIIGTQDSLIPIENALIYQSRFLQNLKAMVLLVPSGENSHAFLER